MLLLEQASQTSPLWQTQPIECHHWKVERRFTTLVTDVVWQTLAGWGRTTFHQIAAHHTDRKAPSVFPTREHRDGRLTLNFHIKKWKSDICNWIDTMKSQQKTHREVLLQTLAHWWVRQNGQRQGGKDLWVFGLHATSMKQTHNRKISTNRGMKPSWLRLYFFATMRRQNNHHWLFRSMKVLM